MKYNDIKMYARRLRKNPTDSEKELWKHLRKRQLKGRRFLRQHPLIYQFIDSEKFVFIPDFYCHQESLIIEIDGKIHDNQMDKDQCRQQILEQQGFTVLRFNNEELSNISKILETIASHFKQ